MASEISEQSEMCLVATTVSAMEDRTHYHLTPKQPYSLTSHECLPCLVEDLLPFTILLLLGLGG